MGNDLGNGSLANHVDDVPIRDEVESREACAFGLEILYWMCIERLVRSS